MGGHHNISKQDFIHLGTGHDRWMREVFLELLDGQSTLLDPLKSFPFIHQQKEGSASVR